MENSGARLAVVEQRYLDPMLEVMESCPELEQVVLVEGGGPAGTLDWTGLEGAGERVDVEAAAAGTVGLPVG